VAGVRRAPRGQLRSGQAEMHRTLNGFFRGGTWGRPGLGGGRLDPARRRLRDRRGPGPHRRAAGVSEDTVSTEVHHRTLPLRGERKPAAAVQGERYDRRKAPTAPSGGRACCRRWRIRGRCRGPLMTAPSHCACPNGKAPNPGGLPLPAKQPL
jgi:hypothetical protein